MYVLSELFFYKLIFVLEILVAMHLFSFKQVHKNHFALRLILSSLVCLVLAAGFPIPPDLTNSIYTSMMFLVLFLYCLVSLFFVYEISFRIVFFIGITAYTMQHFAHEVYSLIVNSFNMVISPTLGLYGNNVIDFSKLSLESLFYGFIYLDIYLAIYWVVYAILGKRINKRELIIENYSMVIIAGIVLLVDIVLNAVIIYIRDGYSKTYSIVSCIYNLLCCSMVLYMQFSLAINKHLKSELQTTMHLLKQAEDQYKESKENVDIINVKCHDLKHQLMEYAKNGQMDSKLVKELENVINIYDSTIKTGNEALDLILSEKSLICQKKSIKLTCLADCSKLSFIDKADLYSLFGNIIDNAIEAVSKIKDVDKRHISLIVKNINSFISISVDNYYDGDIVLGENGLPLTTKKDKDYHGFGMKSIQLVVNKYDGDLNVNVANNVFSLSIMFPVK